jgi:hypothetical protein
MDLDTLPPDERLEVLTAYLDGELPAEAAREVTAWLERHPEALREIEHQRRLWDLLGRYQDEPVPAGFAERTLGATRGLSALRSLPVAAPRTTHRWAYAAAAAVLLAVGAFALRSRGASDVGAGGPNARDEGTLEVATLESIDLDYVQHANLDELLALSDEQFAALLAGHPDALADEALGESVPEGPRGG